jgi:hypothetical protein
MKTTLVISTMLYAALLAAVSTTALTSLAPSANAQTQGGCSTATNPQGFNCQNPHNTGGPPVPSCASPLAVGHGGSDPCRVNPSSP